MNLFRKHTYLLIASLGILVFGLVPSMAKGQISSAGIAVKDVVKIDSVNYDCISGNVQIVVLSPPATCQYYVLTNYPNTVAIPPANTYGSFYLGGANTTVFRVESNGCYRDTLISYDCGGLSLALEFLTFDATLINVHQGLLTWKVKEEPDVIAYQIDKSHDGSNFEFFYKLNVIGTDSVKSYSHVDPLLWSGDNYYKLTSIHQDGSTATSTVRVLNYNGTYSPTISIYPIPTKRYITASFVSAHDDKLICKIIDDRGRLVMCDQNISVNQGQNDITIDLERLSSATYYVQFSFVKQNIQLSSEIIKAD